VILFLAACTNTMSADATAPFSLGTLKSALFIADAASAERADYGRAYLILSSTKLRCQDVQAPQWSSGDDTVLWEDDHVIATVYWSYSPFDWEDYQEGDGRAGWQGTYGSGVNVQERAREGTVYRQFWLDVASSGTQWELDGQLGLLEIGDSDGSTARGTLDHQSVDARFAAENCGTQEPEEWDTGYYW